MDCLTENEIAGWVEGTLPVPALARARAHIDQCAACRSLVASVARSESSAPPSRPSPAQPPQPGSQFGRYVLEGLLGVGGMGWVYAAYDPKLERKVALKLLSDREMVLHEARTAARVSHPNVIVVHDVDVAEGQPFVSMELVEGDTLRQWLRRSKRSWREIYRLFLRAGEGLVAAHEAGLVHRDFKPDNVLVGADGRIRVTDFGLVRAVASPAPGAIQGTPGYMAPEQLRGGSVDARADQFAFCVSFFEALTGERPPDPLMARVPRWIAPVLRRGLSADPQERYASLRDLLSALKQGERRARWTRRGAVAGAAVVLLAVMSWRASVASHRCDADPRWLAGAWDAATREQVRKALLATGVPYAPKVADEVERALDRYGQDFLRAQSASCSIGSRAWDDCLVRAKESLGSLTQTLATADADVVRQAVHATNRLPPPRQCLTAWEKNTPVPSSPTRDAAWRELIAVRTLQYTGHVSEAFKRVTQLAESLPAEDRLLQTEILFAHGELAARGTDLQLAERQLNRALWLAIALGNAELEVRITSCLANLVGGREGHYEEGLRFAAHGAAAAERLDPSSLFAAYPLLFSSRIHHLQGQYPLAKAENERAIAVFERADGDQMPEFAALLLAQAQVLTALNEREEALQLHNRATDILRRAVGPDDPQYAVALIERAEFLDSPKDAPLALADYAEGIRVLEQTSPPGNVSLVEALDGMATLELDLGRPKTAAAHLRQVLGIDQVTTAPTTPEAAISLSKFALALSRSGDRAAALTRLAQSKQVFDTSRAPPPISTDRWRYESEILNEAGDVHGALRAANDALRSLPPHARPIAVARAQLRLGRALAGAKRFSESKESLEKAEGLFESSEPYPLEHAEALAALAEVEDALGGRPAAREHAAQALALLTPLGEEQAAARAQVSRLLARR